MMHQLTNTERADSNRKILYQVGGAAAVLVSVLLLIAMVSLVTAGLGFDTRGGWFPQFENNWLVVLFKLNAGFEGVHFDLLHGLNPLDIVIMALVAAMYPGLYTALKGTSRIGSILALIQPFLGIVIFIVTNTAGRSAVMGAGLVISLVMLRSNILSKAIALVGILASVSLLVGDFSTTADAHSMTIATLIGIGYVLEMIWFLLIGRRLLQLGRAS